MSAADSLDLYLVTFNCARLLVNPSSFGHSLFDALPEIASLPDLVVISLQEIAPIALSFLGGSNLQPYYDRVCGSLSVAAERAGHEHVYQLVAAKSIGMTSIMLFANSESKMHIRIRSVQFASVGIGLLGMGNKGAIGVRVGVAPLEQGTDQFSLTFIAAHLAPMEGGVQRRNADWKTLVQNLVFEPDAREKGELRPQVASRERSSEEEPLLPSTAIELSDCIGEALNTSSGLYGSQGYVFFAGDLNYRTCDSPPSSNSHLEFPQPTKSVTSSTHFSRLLQYDQLSRERLSGRVLHGFDEAPINFPPTYKYLHKIQRGAAQAPVSAVREEGEDREGDGQEYSWNWAKHRYPSWCDRILFYPCLHGPHTYTSLPIQQTSDHRPVALSLSLTLDPSIFQRSSQDLRKYPPFKINPSWKQRRNNGRILEILVGVVAWLVLTGRGNITLLFLIALVSGVVFTAWLLGL